MWITKLFKFIILTGLPIIASLGVAFAEEPQIQQSQYKHYSIKLEKHPEIGTSADKILIMDNGKEVFTTEGSISVQQGYELEEINDPFVIKSPILIINEYSGGAHCCYTTTILNLSEKFKILAIFKGGHSPIELRKSNHEANFEVKLDDWTYAYRWTSFADSYAPRVILHSKGGKYVPDVEAMRKPPLSKKQLDEIISTINSDKYISFKYAYKDNMDTLAVKETRSNGAYFDAVLKIVLDLIYSGQASQAWYVIDKTWPSDSQSKQLFIKDLKQAIRESPYFEAINTINKSGTL